MKCMSNCRLTAISVQLILGCYLNHCQSHLAGAQSFDERVNNISVQMSVQAVIGDDGDKLVAGKSGWLGLAFKNMGDKKVELSTASFNGKGASEKTPSYVKWHSFYGLGIAKLTSEFVPTNANVKTPSRDRLAPPDDPVVLKPKEERLIWRRIVAPTTAGRYRLRVRFSNLPVIDTENTQNFRKGGVTEYVETDCLSEEFEILAASDSH